MILKNRSILLDLVRNDKIIIDMRDISGGASKSPKKMPNKYIQAFENTFTKMEAEDDDDEDLLPTPKLMTVRSENLTFTRK